MSKLTETFFQSGLDFWTAYAAMGERSPALPANSTVALGLVAFARAERTLPLARRHAAGVLSFVPESIRNQVIDALLANGLVYWNIAGALDLTEHGNAAVAALREPAAAITPEDRCDLPPSPSAADPSPAAPTEEFREEEQVIPFAAPEDYLEPPEEDDEELPEKPILWSQAVEEYELKPPTAVKPPPKPLVAVVQQPTSVAEKPTEPRPRRKLIVNREPPGVPRY